MIGTMNGTAKKAAWWYQLLAITSGLLPWIGGVVFATLTTNVSWLAFLGVIVTLIATTGAFVCRRTVDPVGAKQWLIGEPILFGCYYMFAVIIMRYVFLR